eukprot:gene2236-2950_t
MECKKFRMQSEKLQRQPVISLVASLLSEFLMVENSISETSCVEGKPGLKSEGKPDLLSRFLNDTTRLRPPPVKRPVQQTAPDLRVSPKPHDAWLEPAKAPSPPPSPYDPATGQLLPDVVTRRVAHHDNDSFLVGKAFTFAHEHIRPAQEQALRHLLVYGLRLEERTKHFMLCCSRPGGIGTSGLAEALESLVLGLRTLLGEAVAPYPKRLIYVHFHQAYDEESPEGDLHQDPCELPDFLEEDFLCSPVWVRGVPALAASSGAEPYPLVVVARSVEEAQVGVTAVLLGGSAVESMISCLPFFTLGPGPGITASLAAGHVRFLLSQFGAVALGRLLRMRMHLLPRGRGAPSAESASQEQMVQHFNELERSCKIAVGLNFSTVWDKWQEAARSAMEPAWALQERQASEEKELREQARLMPEDSELLRLEAEVQAEKELRQSHTQQNLRATFFQMPVLARIPSKWRTVVDNGEPSFGPGTNLSHSASFAMTSLLSTGKGEQENTSKVAEGKPGEEEPEMSSMDAFKWTIRWMLRTCYWACFRIMGILLWLSLWRVGEAMLIDQIFKDAIGGDAGKSTIDRIGSSILYIGAMVVGTVLSSQCVHQLELLKPSGGNFLPVTKVQIVEQLAKVQQETLDDLNLQDVLASMEQDLLKIDNNIEAVVTVMLSSMQILSTFIFLMISSYKLATVYLVLFPLFIFLNAHQGVKISEATNRLLELNHILYNVIREQIAHLTTRRYLGLDRRFHSLLSKEAHENTEGFNALDLANASHERTMRLAGDASKVVTLIMGSILVGGGWEISSFIAFYVSAQGLIELLVSTSGTTRQFHVSCVPLASLTYLMSLDTVDDTTGARLPAGVHAPQIEFKDVSFTFKHEVVPALSVSASIKPGSKVGIIGQSSAGKSTFIKLLSRMYKPVTGEITVGGVPLSTIADVPSIMAVMEQETLLFEDSIRNNILIGRSVSDTALMRAISGACLLKEQVVRRHGLDYQVGLNGAKLAQSLRQRVCLARVILRNVPILVLDEPCSAQEHNHTQEISRALKDWTHLRNGELYPTTVFVTTQRLMLVDGWDEILMLVGGELVEGGPPEVLYQQHGHYWHMVNEQTGLEFHHGKASITPERLQKLWPFALAAPEELLPIASMVQTHTFEDGEVLFTEGAKATELLIVVNGTLAEMEGENVIGDEDESKWTEAKTISKAVKAPSEDSESGLAMKKRAKQEALDRRASKKYSFLDDQITGPRPRAHIRDLFEDNPGSKKRAQGARSERKCRRLVSFGDSVGEECLMGPWTWPAQGEAQGECTVLALGKAALKAALSRLPALKEKLTAQYNSVQKLRSPQRLGLIWPLEGVPDECMQAVRRLLKVEVFEKGMELVGAEDPSKKLFILLSGEVATRETKQVLDKRLVEAVGKYSEGQHLGELAPFLQETGLNLNPSIEAKVTQDTMAITLTRESIDRLRRADDAVFSGIEGNLQRYQDFGEGKFLAKHWLFGHLPSSSQAELAKLFEVYLAVDGHLIFSDYGTMANKGKVICILKGTVFETYTDASTKVGESQPAISQVGESQPAISQAVVNYNTVLDMLATSSDVDPAQSTNVEMQCSGHCLVASCSVATVTAFISRHMPAETVEALLGMRKVRSRIRSTEGLQELGLAFLPPSQLAALLAVAQTRIVFQNEEVGMQKGEASAEQGDVAATPRKLVILLQGRLTVLTSHGSSKELNDRGVMKSENVITSNTRGNQVVASVTGAWVKSQIATLLVFDFNLISPEKEQEFIAAQKTLQEEADQRKRLRQRIADMYVKIREVQIELGLSQKADPEQMWQRARMYHRLGTQFGVLQRSSSGLTAASMTLTLIEEEAEDAKRQLEEVQALAEERRATQAALLQEWRDHGRIPQDVHFCPLPSDKIPSLEYIDEIRRKMEEVRVRRIALMHETYAILEKLWQRGHSTQQAGRLTKLVDGWSRPPGEGDTEVRSKEAMMRRASVEQLVMTTFPTSHVLQAIREEIRSERAQMRPEAAILVERLRSLKKELHVAVTPEEEERYKTHMEDPHEDVIDELRGQLAKLEYAVSVVRPLRTMNKGVLKLRNVQAEQQIVEAHHQGRIDTLLQEKLVLERQLGIEHQSVEEEGEGSPRPSREGNPVEKFFSAEQEEELMTEIEQYRMELHRRKHRREQLKRELVALVEEIGLDLECVTETLARHTTPHMNPLGFPALSGLSLEKTALEKRRQQEFERRDGYIARCRTLWADLGVTEPEQNELLERTRAGNLLERCRLLAAEAAELESILQSMDERALHLSKLVGKYASVPSNPAVIKKADAAAVRIQSNYRRHFAQMQYQEARALVQDVQLLLYKNGADRGAYEAFKKQAFTNDGHEDSHQRMASVIGRAKVKIRELQMQLLMRAVMKLASHVGEYEVTRHEQKIVQERVSAQLVAPRAEGEKVGTEIEEAAQYIADTAARFERRHKRRARARELGKKEKKRKKHKKNRQSKQTEQDSAQLQDIIGSGESEMMTDEDELFGGSDEELGHNDKDKGVFLNETDHNYCEEQISNMFMYQDNR